MNEKAHTNTQTPLHWIKLWRRLSHGERERKSFHLNCSQVNFVTNTQTFYPCVLHMCVLLLKAARRTGPVFPSQDKTSKYSTLFTFYLTVFVMDQLATSPRNNLTTIQPSSIFKGVSFFPRSSLPLSLPLLSVTFFRTYLSTLHVIGHLGRSLFYFSAQIHPQHPHMRFNYSRQLECTYFSAWCDTWFHSVGWSSSSSLS